MDYHDILRETGIVLIWAPELHDKGFYVPYAEEYAVYRAHIEDYHKIVELGDRPLLVEYHIECIGHS